MVLKSTLYDAREITEKEAEIVLPSINQSISFKGVLLSSTQVKEFPISSRLEKHIFTESIDEIKDVNAKDEMINIVSLDLELLKEARRIGFQTSWYIEVFDQKTMNEAVKHGVENPTLILDFKDETNIPLELVIAKLQEYKINIVKRVTSTNEGRISFDVMEVGANGILLSSHNVEEILSINNLIQKTKNTKLEIIKATVKKVEHLDAGERACIDTTSLLTKEEAMVVGSTSSGGLMVCSETHYLPYMNTRPFRVNAGAVHSYVWCPDDTTEYITDLRVGNQVIVVDLEGNCRAVNVGRMKIEVRPLLLIECEYQGISINTIVQDDWHIRIFDGNGNPKSATTFKPGDEIMAYVCDPGRHMGVKISETITEQ
ncbi:3-dehydroquinate synthase II [Halobacillus sp. HZG1]|uniref:3-dehydroquinate synthase II n=1 Tax=Halobacillus sp. HZG1 TaxID=3111769 RepID=UPI002DB91A2B|nr:3-dehydroquinate synthase II [Halobacillus sp. HZG1]MEC3885151.1 3-dehydroquinate synthase II [Halobacillus sp. HZG1]